MAFTIFEVLNKLGFGCSKAIDPGPSVFVILTIFPLKYFHCRVKETFRKQLQLGSRQGSDGTEQEEDKEKEDIRMEEAGMKGETGMEEGTGMEEETEMEEETVMGEETGIEYSNCPLEVERKVTEKQKLFASRRTDTVLSSL